MENRGDTIEYKVRVRQLNGEEANKFIEVIQTFWKERQKEQDEKVGTDISTGATKD
jgi:hypothetical protein